MGIKTLAMTLEVQICTFGAEGLSRVAKMSLPIMADVLYTVCLQNPKNDSFTLPPELDRKDIRILAHNSIGLSNNRNFGIDNAVGDIILIADDDLNYKKEGLKAVVSAFEKNPNLDFAAFKHCGGDNKKFPETEFDFRDGEPKGYYLTSFELAFRRQSLPHGLRFSSQLGVGAPIFRAAEESVFLFRLKKEKLRGKFFPVTIVQHPGMTTGVREATEGSLCAQGAWIWIRYGWIEGFLRVLRDVPRRNTSPAKAAKGLIKGYLLAHRYFSKDGKDR